MARGLAVLFLAEQLWLSSAAWSAAGWAGLLKWAEQPRLAGPPRLAARACRKLPSSKAAPMRRIRVGS